MAKGPFTIKVKGVQELRRNVKDPLTLGQPMRRFYRRSVAEINRRVQKNLSKRTDTGAAANSIEIEVDGSPIPTFGRVFSNKFYLYMLEGGTRPHFPEIGGKVPDKLISWAAKRGLNPYAVAVNISRNGTKRRSIFNRARFASNKAIARFSDEASADIKRLIERK